MIFSISSNVSSTSGEACRSRYLASGRYLCIRPPSNDSAPRRSLTVSAFNNDARTYAESTNATRAGSAICPGFLREISKYLHSLIGRPLGKPFRPIVGQSRLHQPRQHQFRPECAPRHSPRQARQHKGKQNSGLTGSHQKGSRLCSCRDQPTRKNIDAAFYRLPGFADILETAQPFEPRIRRVWMYSIVGQPVSSFPNRVSQMPFGIGEGTDTHGLVPGRGRHCG
jgi:hypothetical protein